MNRLLIHDPCPCSRARRYVEKLKEAAGRVETIAGGIVETCVPGVDRIVDEGVTGFGLWLNIEPDRVTDLDNAEAMAALELRRIGDELHRAAERLEGGAV